MLARHSSGGCYRTQPPCQSKRAAFRPPSSINVYRSASGSSLPAVSAILRACPVSGGGGKRPDRLLHLSGKRRELLSARADLLAQLRAELGLLLEQFGDRLS